MTFNVSHGSKLRIEYAGGLSRPEPWRPAGGYFEDDQDRQRFWKPLAEAMREDRLANFHADCLLAIIER